MPDFVIVPVEDWKDTNELRPAGTALTDGREFTGPRISAPVAHQDCFDLLLIDQPLHFGLEVGAEKLHLDAVELFDFVSESLDLVKLSIFDKMDVFNAPESLICFAIELTEGPQQMKNNCAVLPSVERQSDLFGWELVKGLLEDRKRLLDLISDVTRPVLDFGGLCLCL